MSGRRWREGEMDWTVDVRLWTDLGKLLEKRVDVGVNKMRV
jgi:hypothetical protein